MCSRAIMYQRDSNIYLNLLLVSFLRVAVSLLTVGMDEIASISRSGKLLFARFAVSATIIALVPPQGI